MTPTKTKIFRPWEMSPKKCPVFPNPAVTIPQTLDLRMQSSPPVISLTTLSTGTCSTPCSPLTQDSGYLSDMSTTPENSPSTPSHPRIITPVRPSISTPSRPTGIRRHLSEKAVDMMEEWYCLNFDHPYPSDQVVQYIADQGDITVTQVKKWMANKRVRSFNTLASNGSVHPKRLQRLHKQSTGRKHPYSHPKGVPPQISINMRSPVGLLPLKSPLFPTFGVNSQDHMVTTHPRIASPGLNSAFSHFSYLPFSSYGHPMYIPLTPPSSLGSHRQ